MARLSGLNVLIVGTEPVLADAVLGRLVAEGARVIAATHRPEAGPAAGTGAHVETIEISPLDPDSWQLAVAEIEQRFGALHGVVLGGSSRAVGSLDSIDPHDVRSVIEHHLLGPTLGVQASAPLLAASGGGSMILVASSDARRGAPGAAVVAASHWGLRGLARSAALELGPSGIRVNTVCPSPDRSDGGEAAALGDRGQVRSVTAGDVAAMVAFLLSDDSATCTGGDFAVDGGLSA